MELQGDTELETAKRTSHLSFLASSYEIQGEFTLALHSYRAQQAILAAQQQTTTQFPPVSEPSSCAVSNSIIRRRIRNASSSLLSDLSTRLAATATISSPLPPLSADSLVPAIPLCSNYDTMAITKRSSPNTSLGSSAEENTPKRSSKSSDFSLPRPLNDTKPVASTGAVSKLTSAPFRNKLISSTNRQKPATNYGNTNNGNRQRLDVTDDGFEDQPAPQQPQQPGGFKSSSKKENLAKTDPAAAARYEAAEAERKAAADAADLPAAKRRKISETGPEQEEDMPPEYRGIDPDAIERVKSEILEADLNVKFDDIAGLEKVKKTLYEMIIYPNLHPSLFQGLRSPPRGLLLFGPPGNGKTMIAKAVASEAKMTFFSVSAASLTSKWIGEGEKTVRALFAVAKVHQPSFIFIDEIDAILSSRSSEEHESTRRLKNEFLIQFGGAIDSADVRVTVMGATNRPQDLDEAARRRLPKRVYVPLPEYETRHHLITNLLKKEDHTYLTKDDFKKISQLTEGYSCSDISQVCREAAMIPLREVDLGSRTHVSQSELRPLELKDFVEALKYVKSSVSLAECKVYEDFNEQFSTVGKS